MRLPSASKGKKLAAPIVAAGGADPARPELVAAAAQVDALCERLNQRVRLEVERWLSAGKLVGSVGGDHSTVFGAIAATAAAHPRMGILHLDAHADLRPAFEGFRWSHASIMDNVASQLPQVSRIVQVGIRDLSEEEHQRIQDSKGRIVTHFDQALGEARLSGMSFGEICDGIADELPEEVYLSFDIDGLDPSLCPHTGTPVPGGLSFREVNLLLKSVVRAGKRIVGFDLNEVTPGPDGDEWDANVGARLLYKMIGWTLKSNQ